MNQQPLIAAQHLTYSIRGEKILDDISLEVVTGEYLGLIGPNGAGKTTLLRMLLGLLQPDSGTISLFGKPIDEFHNWTKIGYVPQKATHFDTSFPISVEEVVAQGRVGRIGMFKVAAAADEEAINHALKTVDMEMYRHRLITELSGGQQQRVLIARALASEPELLILDEPTVGVDLKSQELFYEFLSELNRKKGLTLILVSHDIDVVVNEVSKIACINQTLIYHGSPKEFMTEEYLHKLYGKQRKFILHGH